MQDTEKPAGSPLDSYVLKRETSVDAGLQAQLEAADASLREKYEMTAQQTAAGVLDFRTMRLATIRPDRLFYGASVPKIVILLAYFQLNPDAATKLDPTVRNELGLMIKKSSNELAAKYSQLVGLQKIRSVIDQYELYDPAGGAGLWVGKHYGITGERVGDPIGDHSHAATVRQLLRFYILLEQGKLVSPEACKTMKEIFASPDIPHERNKFVKGLKGRDRQILRKSGSWENWLHDTALVTGPNYHYVLVGLTEHPKGDEYLPELAARVDDALKP
jgi:beta-lactamase class A